MANLLLGITIALLPLYIRVTNLDFGRISKDNLLMAVFLALIALMPSKKREISKSLLVAFGYGIFSLVLNQWYVASSNVILQVFYISIGMTFFVKYYECHSIEDTHYLLNGMSAGCLIQSIITIISHFDIPVYYYLITLFNPVISHTGPSFKTVGSLGNPNLLASYLCLTSIALFRNKWVFFLPFPLIALYLADSSMGWIGFIAGTLYYFNLKFKIIPKLWVYLISAISMVGVFFIGVDGRDTHRFVAWRALFSEVDLKHFLFGMGPGWFADKGIIINQTERMVHEHNAFISAFNVFGIVVFALLLPECFRYLRSKDTLPIFSSILFAAFWNSFGHFSLHQSTVAIIIITVAAICLAEGNNNVVNMER